MNESV